MSVSRAQIVEWLRARGDDQHALFSEARRLRSNRSDAGIKERALVELTNRCRVNCLYCPMRRKNSAEIDPFLMSAETIVAAALHARASSFETLYLQGGEIPQTTRRVCDALPRVQEVLPSPITVVLGLGTKTRREYESLFHAGATGYILAFETADPELHRKVRERPLDERTQAIADLTRVGFSVGSGFIVGLPGQGLDGVVNDIRFALDLPVDSISVTPFIPAGNTPLAQAAPADINLALNAIAALRVLRPSLHILAPPGLNVLAIDGVRRGIAAGADLVDVNLTPGDLRIRYPIYGRRDPGNDHTPVEIDHSNPPARKRGTAST